jgi:hypothetical protein
VGEGPEKSNDGQKSLNGHPAQPERVHGDGAEVTVTEADITQGKSRAPRTETVPEGRHIEPWKHVAVWSVGVILASLIPIGWAYESGRPGAITPSIYQLLETGELYPISIVLVIAGIAEIVLLFRWIKHSMTVALLVLSALIVVTIDCARYAGASALPVNYISPPHSTTYVSIALFCFSALHSSICVWLAVGTR